MTEKDKKVEEPFLNRWSRLKQKDNAGLIGPSDTDENNQVEISSELSTGGNEAGVKEPQEKELAKNREAAEAIDLETLTYESDFAPFMKKGVPEILKNHAMRKLWKSNPILANVDGLNDYDENFADPALNVFKSKWKVGRGFLTKEDDDRERLRKLRLLEEPNEGEKNTQDKKTSDAKDQSKGGEIPVEATAVQSDEITSEPEAENKASVNEQFPIAMKDNYESALHHEKEREQNDALLKRVSLRKRLLDD